MKIISEKNGPIKTKEIKPKKFSNKIYKNTTESVAFLLKSTLESK